MPRSIPLLLAAGLAILTAGCACGSSQPDQSTTTDRLDALPLGLYTPGADDWREAMQCDSARNCVLRFRDFPESTTVWTVHFTLEPAETTKVAYRRRYL